MMDIEEYTRYSPLQAALSGRDDAGRKAVFKNLSELPEEMRSFLLDPATAEKIRQWELAGILPAAYAVAVAKLVALTVFGKVALNDIAALLVRTGLPEAAAAKTAEAVQELVRPVLAFRRGSEEPRTLAEREVPPLTVSKPRAPTSPGAAPRNIIDLRKRP